MQGPQSPGEVRLGGVISLHRHAAPRDQKPGRSRLFSGILETPAPGPQKVRCLVGKYRCVGAQLIPYILSYGFFGDFNTGAR